MSCFDDAFTLAPTFQRFLWNCHPDRHQAGLCIRGSLTVSSQQQEPLSPDRLHIKLLQRSFQADTLGSVPPEWLEPMRQLPSDRSGRSSGQNTQLFLWQQPVLWRVKVPHPLSQQSWLGEPIKWPANGLLLVIVQGTFTFVVQDQDSNIRRSLDP